MGASINPFNLLQSIGGALVVLVVVVVVGWFAIVRLRRWMRSEADDPRAFTLDDLRRLHREGRLSDDEFQRARDAMIQAVQRAAARQDGAESAPRSGRTGATKSDLSVDFGVGPGTARTDPQRANRTHPPTSPRRPPQLGE